MSQFEAICVGLNLPKPVQEYQFCPGRKWRFDWAWPEYKVSLEIEGGVWIKGRHTRGLGYTKDLEKYSEAAILGWCVIRVTPKQMNNLEATELVARALTTRKPHVQGVVVKGTDKHLDVSNA